MPVKVCHETDASMTEMIDPTSLFDEQVCIVYILVPYEFFGLSQTKDRRHTRRLRHISRWTDEMEALFLSGVSFTAKPHDSFQSHVLIHCQS